MPAKQRFDVLTLRIAWLNVSWCNGSIEESYVSAASTSAHTSAITNPSASRLLERTSPLVVAIISASRQARTRFRTQPASYCARIRRLVCFLYGSFAVEDILPMLHAKHTL